VMTLLLSWPLVFPLCHTFSSFLPGGAWRTNCNRTGYIKFHSFLW
jgi:hypothetical protein